MKRKLVPIKLIVSVKSSIQSLNFMVIIGMHTLIYFLMKTLNIQLESMMTKIILLSQGVYSDMYMTGRLGPGIFWDIQKNEYQEKSDPKK